MGKSINAHVGVRNEDHDLAFLLKSQFCMSLSINDFIDLP